MFEETGVRTLAVGREKANGELQITIRQLTRALREVPADTPVSWSDGMCATCISACRNHSGASIGSAWGETPAEGLQEQLRDACGGFVDDEGELVRVTGDTPLWRADPGDHTDEMITAIYFDGLRVLLETGEAE